MFTFMSAQVPERVLYVHTFHQSVFDVSVCPQQHLEIPPRYVPCSFQNSSSSDNKMTKSSIISLIVYYTGSMGAYGLMASTHTTYVC